MTAGIVVLQHVDSQSMLVLVHLYYNKRDEQPWAPLGYGEPEEQALLGFLSVCVCRLCTLVHLIYIHIYIYTVSN